MFLMDVAREPIKLGGVPVKLGREPMGVRSLAKNIVPLSIINLNDKGKNERFIVQGNLCFAKTGKISYRDSINAV